MQSPFTELALLLLIAAAAGALAARVFARGNLDRLFGGAHVPTGNACAHGIK